MRKVHAVMVDKAERRFVAASQDLRAAAHSFSLAREAKKRADKELLEALSAAARPER